MNNEFSVVARRGFQSKVVGTYESLAEAADAIILMRGQGGSLGFHSGYDVLYKDEPILWKQSYAETAREVVDELVSYGKLENMTDEERLVFVKTAMTNGTIVATGEYVGMLG